MFVAIFVSYTALNLAIRVSAASSTSARWWHAGGAIAMGGGIWSMHFIGMLAFSLPISLAYDVGKTLAVARHCRLPSRATRSRIAGRRRTTLLQLAMSAVVMGFGICAMHYSGMSAIEILPIITYEPWLLVASVVIAVVASFAALWLFVRQRVQRTLQAHLTTLGAAIIMGLAISGMHYTGMAASRFSPDSFCITATGANGTWLAVDDCRCCHSAR